MSVFMSNYTKAFNWLNNTFFACFYFCFCFVSSTTSFKKLFQITPEITNHNRCYSLPCLLIKYTHKYLDTETHESQELYLLLLLLTIVTKATVHFTSLQLKHAAAAELAQQNCTNKRVFDTSTIFVYFIDQETD